MDNERIARACPSSSGNVVEMSWKRLLSPWHPGQLSPGAEPKKVKSAGYYVNLRLAAVATGRAAPLA
jgi:hypothetical protein